MFSVLRVRNRQVFRKNVPRMPCFSSVAAAGTCWASASSKVSDTTVVAQRTVPAAQTFSPGLPAVVQDRSSEASAEHGSELSGGVGGGTAGRVVGGLLGGASGFVPPQARSKHQTAAPTFRTAFPLRDPARRMIIRLA